MGPAPDTRSHSRTVLALGFGGLLLLMIFGGFDYLRALRQIQADDDQIREDFLLRTRTLERIRSDLYLSGTFVRDYLLEPEANKAESHRRSLAGTRADMDAALREYQGLMNAAESRPFQTLTHDLDGYWKLLDPVFAWTAAERQKAGYIFLRDEVFPRRTAMLGIADQIGATAQAQLQAGKRRLAESFAESERRLTATIGLTIGLGILLAVFTIRQMLGLESEAAKRYREIVQAREELKQLSARLVHAQEEERRSISRELHDEVGQALSSVMIEMANLSRLIGARAMDAREKEVLDGKAAEIKELVENSIRVVRNMALLLRPSMLDDLGLVPALQWQAREVSKTSGLQVKVAAEHVSEQLQEELKTCVYRLVQEALHNCVQHANASNVRVSVRQENSRILLSIQDDGKGFDGHKERGMGLLGMEERVSHLGGSLALESAPGHGTVLRVVLPITESARAAQGGA